MNGIKTAILIGCLLGIAFAVMKNTVPNKKLFESFKLVMSLVMLVSIINAVTKIDFEISFGDYTLQADQTSTELAQAIDRQYINEIENSAEKSVMSYLKNNGVNVQNVVIQTLVDEYNNLEIDYIKLFIEKTDKTKAENLTKSLLGEEIKLEIVEYEE